MRQDRRSRSNFVSPAAVGTLLCAVFAVGLPAQVHKVAATQKVVRAVGVYEWTGDLAKPTGARLIPVSLFIDGRLEDADLYRSDPVPFALDTGNVYQLEKAGIVQGTLDIAFARKLVPTTTAYTNWDDGWFGYGKFLPPAPPKKSNLKPITTPIKVNGLDDLGDDDKPHFSSRSAVPGSGGAAASAPGTTPAASSTPAADPDRPTLHRASGSGSDSSANSGIPDDPDRPTLKKHASAPAGTSTTNEDVTAIGSPMTDTNRPLLHRGKSESSFGEADLPKLIGLPVDSDLNQMAAVSDAVDRQPHDFARPWGDDAERTTILGKMRDAAHAALTAYEKANGLSPNSATPTPASAAAPPALKRAPANAAHRTATKKTAPAPPAPEPLVDEKLTGYLLSYGGSPTFVYSAHTDGVGAAERFVTIVAQENQQGEPEIALKNVTDAAHLDRTPRMRLVDAVDAEASNRASLLFELRAQSSRQFALYRVIGGRSDQSFLTGATQ
jgi:hypothetical protein